MERVHTILSHVAPRGPSAPAHACTVVGSVCAQEEAPARVVQTSVSNAVGVLRFDRPKALNAFNTELVRQTREALVAFDRDPAVRAIVVTGNGRAFAAGADIKGMADRGIGEMLKNNDHVDSLANLTENISTPIIAAVNGYALGGGCEFMMMCDIALMARSAKLGQPEIKIGTIPGAGGTQRLVRAIGKSKAMELVLTGRTMSAEEAERAGLVSQVVDDAELMPTALKLAESIANLSAPIVAIAKRAVNKSQELALQEGLEYERTVFQTTFAFDDKKEGMRAFVEKRKPQWKHC